MAPKKDKRSASLIKYLSNQSDVVNARQALSNYAQTYKGIELQFKNTPASSKNFSTIVAEYRDAETKINALQKQLDDAEEAASLRFEEQQTEKAETKKVQDTFDIETQLNPLYIERNQRYVKQGLPVPATLNSQITELETKLREKGGRPTPDVKLPPDETDETDSSDTTSSVNLGGYSGIPIDESGAVYPPISDISITDYLMSVYLGGEEKIKELQTALKSAGPKIYKGPIDGIYRAPELTRALQQADVEIGFYEDTGVTFKDRLSALQRLATVKTGDGTGTVPTTTISSRATATTYINAALKQVGIDRVATPQEIDSLFKVLNDAESRFKTTIKNGVTRNLLGDRTQFIANLITTGKYVDPNTGKSIKGVKEDVKKASKILRTLSKSAQTVKADTRSLTVQTLQSTANANGVSLSPQQLEQYALEVQNGKDIKVIQSQIRNVAGAGMPDRVVKLLAEGTDLDTIYSPYKSQMAAILEINPQTINFTDPTLRSAIGPNGEMPLYDFQRALRKDARWQYTNNAREDVFQSVGKVLQDFGFQG
jgi:hypothetical protein